jgi:3',5'-cyclic-AMP phosphodiesterase
MNNIKLQINKKNSRMNHFLKSSLLILAILLAGCAGNTGNSGAENNTVAKSDTIETKTSEFIVESLQADDDTTLLRVAFIGDGEPKPLAEFPGIAAAVEQINTLSQTQPIDFVIGVGDIAHKGTEIQYEAATLVLQQLEVPFYPIMGNEEHNSTVERYMHYAKKWNSSLEQPSYVLNHEKIAFVFASPDHGRDFDDSGASWILEQLQRLAPKPVVLIVHGAQKGVYPENADKGIGNQLFIEKVIPQPNLAAVISGDLHMDMDRVDHSKQIGQVHYLHIPALERTKIPDETNHMPMFRVMTIGKSGAVKIETYAVGESNPREEHDYAFSLNLSEGN